MKTCVAYLPACARPMSRSRARNALDHFDFYVLSDTGNPDVCVAELDAWNALREDLDAESRLFYRHRRRRVKRKSGNIDDFCRRWGAKYRYMVVLDADSVMTGECLTTLVRLMEARRTPASFRPRHARSGATRCARMQQFSNQVYGPMFTAGLLAALNRTIGAITRSSGSSRS